MSILDRGPHTVVVKPKVKVANGYGGFDLVDGAPVAVSGLSVQPVSTEELHALGGTQAQSIRRILGRGPWPGGTHSVVTFEGRDWDQVGEAENYTTGHRSKHFNAIIQARKAEVK